jgi:hypothetical protein
MSSDLSNNGCQAESREGVSRDTEGSSSGAQMDNGANRVRTIWIRVLETAIWIILAVICWMFLAGCS